MIVAYLKRVAVPCRACVFARRAPCVRHAVAHAGEHVARSVVLARTAHGATERPLLRLEAHAPRVGIALPFRSAAWTCAGATRVCIPGHAPHRLTRKSEDGQDRGGHLPMHT